ncbi:GroES-like protein [Thermothelomyces heterothallicus CBS 203.75]
MSGVSFLRRVSLHGFRGRSKSGVPQPETEKPPSKTAPITPETQTVLLLHAARQPYELTENYPVSDLRDDHEVLVQTRAIGLNPVDWKAPDFNFAIPELPYIAGRELAGEVIKRRSSSRLKVGDKVLVISTDYRDLRKSAFQHYVVALDYNTVRLPPSLSHEEGSTLGVAFVAAALSLGVCMGLDFSSVLDGPDLYSLIRQLPPDALAPDVRDECLNALPSQERAQPGDWLAVWGGKLSLFFLPPPSSLFSLCHHPPLHPLN